MVTLLDDMDPGDGCRIRNELHDGDNPVVFATMEGGGHVIPTPQGEDGCSRLFNFLCDRFVGNFCRDAEGADLAWDFLKGKTL